MQGIYRMAAQLVVFRVVLNSTELVGASRMFSDSSHTFVSTVPAKERVRDKSCCRSHTFYCAWHIMLQVAHAALCVTRCRSHTLYCAWQIMLHVGHAVLCVTNHIAGRTRSIMRNTSCCRLHTLHCAWHIMLQVAHTVLCVTNHVACRTRCIMRDTSCCRSHTLYYAWQIILQVAHALLCVTHHVAGRTRCIVRDKSCCRSHTLYCAWHTLWQVAHSILCLTRSIRLWILSELDFVISKKRFYHCMDKTLSSTSGGRSVGIVRSRTKGHGVCFFVCLFMDKTQNTFINPPICVLNALNGINRTF
jgi:hypothetical protein